MWYSNLTRVGNIGSAAIFVILDEMMTEGLIKDGDTLLCMVPESGRFVVSFMHLTAVSAATESETQHDPGVRAVGDRAASPSGGRIPLFADRTAARGRRCIDRSACRPWVGHPLGGRPTRASRFPWPIRRFFGVFPAAVDPEALVLVEPAGGFDTEPEELVILAYQVPGPRFPSGRC